MYVYVDIILAINVSMNMIILLLTAWVGRIPYTWWRVLLAAAWGAAYVVAGARPELAFFYTVPLKLIMSISIIVIAFGFKCWKAMFLQIAVFYVVSFVLGGAILGWFFFWYSGDPFMYASRLEQASWILLAGGSLLCIALLFLITKFVLNRMLRQRTLYQAEARYNDKSVVFTALLDTGNALYTIIGRKPVVLVNQKTLEVIMDERAARFLHEYPPEQWLEKLDTCGDDAWLSRIHVIPYRAIGSNSMLLGFRPDGLTVKTENRIVATSNVVLGLYQGNLAHDDMYQALLHPAILTV